MKKLITTILILTSHLIYSQTNLNGNRITITNNALSTCIGCAIGIVSTTTSSFGTAGVLGQITNTGTNYVAGSNITITGNTISGGGSVATNTSITGNSPIQITQVGQNFIIGSTALTFTSTLTGFTASPSSTIVNTDNIVSAFGKTQAQINTLNNATAVQQPLGVRFSDDFQRTTLGSSYVRVGSTATITTVGNVLSVAGGIGTFTEYIRRDDYITNAEDFTTEFTAKVNVVNSTSYGLGIRLDGFSAGSNIQNLQYYVECTNAATSGVIRNGSGNQISDGGFPISAGNIITFKVRVSKNIIYLTATNTTTGLSSYATYQNSLIGNTATLIPNSIKVSLMANGGTFDVYNWKLTVETIKNADYGLLCDSQGGGYYGGAIDGRYFNQLSFIDRSKKFVVYGRQGIITRDIINNLAEITALGVNTWFMAAGFNDVSQGISNTTIISNLTTIKNTLEANGSTVIFLSILKNPTINTSIIGTFGVTNRYIDISKPITNTAGTSYLGKYDSGDGIHPNGPAQIVIANTIINSARDLFPSNNPYLVNDLKFSIYGDAYGNNLTIGTRDSYGLNLIFNNTVQANFNSSGRLFLGGSASANALLHVNTTTGAFPQIILSTTTGYTGTIPGAINNVGNNITIYNAGLVVTTTGTKIITNQLKTNSFETAIRTITTNTTVSATDDYDILVDATAGAITITLPAPVSGITKSYRIKKIDATVNNVIVQGAAGNIDGAANKTFNTQYAAFEFKSDGANYYIF